MAVEKEKESVGITEELLQHAIAYFGASDYEQAPTFLDKMGVDYWLNTRLNDRIIKRVGIDFKIRNYGPNGEIWKDFLYEDLSSKEDNTPGWTIDTKKITDYVGYVLPNKHIHWLPYTLLRNACIKMRPEWVTRQPIPVNNRSGSRTWTTINYIVQWYELWQAMCDVSFGAYREKFEEAGIYDLSF